MAQFWREVITEDVQKIKHYNEKSEVNLGDRRNLENAFDFYHKFHVMNAEFMDREKF